MNKRKQTAGPRPPAQLPSARLQQMMSASAAAPEQVRHNSRKDEGISVPKQFLGTMPDGQLQYSLDAQSTPVPKRRYSADECSISFNGFDGRIVFLQKRLVGAGFESAIVLRVSKGALKELSASFSVTRGPLAALKQAINLPDDQLVDVETQPTTVATMAANLCFMAINRYETCLDFYYASPFAVQAIDDVDLKVDPVVRVDLRTSLFAEIESKLAEFATQFDAD